MDREDFPGTLIALMIETYGAGEVMGHVMRNIAYKAQSRIDAGWDQTQPTPELLVLIKTHQCIDDSFGDIIRDDAPTEPTE